MTCPCCHREAGPLGSIVVDELIVPVIDLRLANRAFVVVAQIQGPVRAVDTHDYIVCDREGRTVYRSSGRNRVEWPALEICSTVIISTEMSIKEVL